MGSSAAAIVHRASTARAADAHRCPPGSCARSSAPSATTGCASANCAATCARALTDAKLLPAIPLARRLDNVVYRLGLASTRAQAHQFVRHGHVLVNGRRVDIPSRPVVPGDDIAILAGSPVGPAAREATELVGRIAGWLLADFDELRGTVAPLPQGAEIDAPVDEQLLVELLARRALCPEAGAQASSAAWGET